MNSRQAHRGPDDDGFYFDRSTGLALAMRRLAILDVEGGRQPMHSPDGRYCLVFNGEIFNAPELRHELEAIGEQFSTDHSDTELLLRLLIREGEKCLDRLNGMFAFTFYDSQEQSLFAARDGFGIKPYYYFAEGGRFAFASELKSLFELPFVDREIDRQALFDYLSMLYVPGSQSILQSVHRLKPGHWLRYSVADQRVETGRWWQLEYEPDDRIPEAEWPERIRDALKKAVSLWSRSDVPVAVSLSGGLDSSAIAAIAAEAGIDISAYSLGFEGPDGESLNELPLARQLARKYSLPHHEIVLQAEALLDALPQMVAALDEPYAGGLPSWFVFERMGQAVKVGLTGTGGDEMFGNYGRWYGFERSPVFRRLFPTARRMPAFRFRRKYFERCYHLSDAAKRQVLADHGAGCVDTADSLLTRFRSAARNLRDATAVLDAETQLADEFLLMTDRFSMAHSLEMRTPFLERGFVDVARRIPARIRTRRGDLKGLLREAVAPFLPQEFLTAPKRGFVVPLGAWIRGRLRPTVEELLEPGRLERQGYLSAEFHSRYVAPHLAGAEDHTLRIGPALMFQFWHRHYMESG